MIALTSVSALLACLLLFGCGDDGAGSSDDLDPQAPLVVYERGGGLAAVPQKLTVSGDGSADVVAGVEGDSRSFELSEDELGRLRELLAAAELADVPAPGDPSACADCFVYTVTYDGTRVSYPQVAEVPASVSAVVEELGRLTEAHLPATAGQTAGDIVDG